ncbi:MAG TPA: zinc ribbon domain-containing protein [Clostridiaceae bacterium]|nr:zinc ribbon domain-containing protein [Clostridiaceae bacterium]
MKGAKSIFCDQCGAKNKDGSKFCTSCGARLSALEYNAYSDGSSSEGSVKPETTVMVADKEDTKDYFGSTESTPGRKGINRKLIFGIVLAAVAVALICGAVSMFGKPDKKTVVRDRTKFPIIYVKSSDLMVKSEGNKEPFVVTSGGNYSSINLKLTADGKTMFFAADPSSRDYRLYYRKVDEKTPKGKDADSVGTRIATGVSSFDIQKEGKFVLYLKDGRLYYNNFKEERLISRNVTFFYKSHDEKKVIFGKDDGNLYICGLGKKDEPEKIDSDVSISALVSPAGNYENLYYIKDSSLYLYQYGKDKKRLARDVESASLVGGQLYIVKRDDFDETGGYKLYKLENEEEIEVADGLLYSYLSSSDYNGGYYDLGDAALFFKMPEDYDGNFCEMYIINGNNPPFKAMDVEISGMKSYNFSFDGKYFYMIEEWDDLNNTGELYRYTVGTDSLKDRTRIHDEVSSFYVADKSVVIRTNTSRYTILGIYADGKYTELSDESGGSTHSGINGVLFYLDEYNDRDGTGTLMRYKNGKTEKIDTEVKSFEVRSDDYIIYIKDFSTRRNYGDLYYKKGGAKPVKVDTDVSYIVRVY